MTLLRVTTDRACFGFVVADDGLVHQSAPIGYRQLAGKDLHQVYHWCVSYHHRLEMLTPDGEWYLLWDPDLGRISQ